MSNHILPDNAFTVTDPARLSLLQLPKSAINAYIKSNTVPNISAQLQHCSKGVAKLPWREDNFSLRPVGVYSLTETKVSFLVLIALSMR